MLLHNTMMGVVRLQAVAGVQGYMAGTQYVPTDAPTKRCSVNLPYRWMMDRVVVAINACTLHLNNFVPQPTIVNVLLTISASHLNTCQNTGKRWSGCVVCPPFATTALTVVDHTNVCTPSATEEFHRALVCATVLWKGKPCTMLNIDLRLLIRSRRSVCALEMGWVSPHRW